MEGKETLLDDASKLRGRPFDCDLGLIVLNL